MCELFCSKLSCGELATVSCSAALAMARWLCRDGRGKMAGVSCPRPVRGMKFCSFKLLCFRPSGIVCLALLGSFLEIFESTNPTLKNLINLSELAYL